MSSPAPLFAVDLLPLGPTGSRPGTRFTPSGLVLHSTADPGATARQIRDYFERLTSPNRASVQLVCDWAEALVCIPWIPGGAEIAWHAGPTANDRFLGMELCETNDPHLFHLSFLRWIEVAAFICEVYHWPADDAHVWSHARVSATWHETDHTDPIGYLEAHGHTWADTLARIQQTFDARTSATPQV